MYTSLSVVSEVEVRSRVPIFFEEKLRESHNERVKLRDHLVFTAVCKTIK